MLAFFMYFKCKRKVKEYEGHLMTDHQERWWCVAYVRDRGKKKDKRKGQYVYIYCLFLLYIHIQVVFSSDRTVGPAVSEPDF